jgi:transcriptional regulator with XRE-family HTH domain
MTRNSSSGRDPRIDFGAVASEREFAESFGRAIKVVRAERNLSRRELAEAAGLSYAYVSDIESGRKPPATRALRALSEALSLQPHQLMARAARIEPEVRFPRTRVMEQREPVEAFSIEPDLPLRHAEVFDYRRPPSAQPAEEGLFDLMELAQSLPEDDVALLIELARRLQKQRNT